MAQDEDGAPPRKGKLSAFALLTSWLFNKRGVEPAQVETEFLNTRDGYELAKFAQKAFGGGDAESKRAHDEAVAAEQAEIDVLLQGTGAVPMPMPVQPRAVPVAAPVAPPVMVPRTPPVAAAPVTAVMPVITAKNQIELAVKYLEKLREQGLSVETLAEALIIIESRDVRQRSQG